jgi:cytochrome d ubiquinol oxidase subunit II
MIIFVGAVVMLPVIGGYSIFAYRVFRGKATALRYE